MLMNKNEITSYEQRYITQIFWVMWVWQDYLNEDMKTDLVNIINKIYEDGFSDWCSSWLEKLNESN